MMVVTGATGHIGNVLVRELLKKGHKVRALLPKFEDPAPLAGLEVEIVPGDIRDRASLRAAFSGVEVVFHLAGIISIEGQTKAVQEVNVRGTQNVVEACIEAKVRRLVYTSTVHAFVEPRDGSPIDEQTPINPEGVEGAYGKSKAEATLAVLGAIERGLDAVVVCPAGVMGPYDYKISEMGLLILDYLRGRLKMYIDGGYDFVDVRDVAEGMIRAYERGGRGEIYILTGRMITIPEIMEILERETGIKPPYFKAPLWLAKIGAVFSPLYYRAMKIRPRFTTYSIKVLQTKNPILGQKARRELGFSPRPLEQSIVDSIEWFKKTGKLPK